MSSKADAQSLVKQLSDVIDALPESTPSVDPLQVQLDAANALVADLQNQLATSQSNLGKASNELAAAKTLLADVDAKAKAIDAEIPDA